MKKLLFLILSLLVISGCGNSEKLVNGSSKSEVIEIQFEDFFTKSDTGEGEITDRMKELNGQKVGIKGYMTELTPIDNRFIYLVPQQGAACPFCSADNPKYLEAIAVYLPEEMSADYSTDLFWAYGTLEVGEEIDELTGLVSMFRLKANSFEVYQSR